LQPLVVPEMTYNVLSGTLSLYTTTTTATLGAAGMPHTAVTLSLFQIFGYEQQLQ